MNPLARMSMALNLHPQSNTQTFFSTLSLSTVNDGQHEEAILEVDRG
jgi:hypothetical protein